MDLRQSTSKNSSEGSDLPPLIRITDENIESLSFNQLISNNECAIKIAPVLKDFIAWKHEAHTFTDGFEIFPADYYEKYRSTLEDMDIKIVESFGESLIQELTPMEVIHYDIIEIVKGVKQQLAVDGLDMSLSEICSKIWELIISLEAKCTTLLTKNFYKSIFEYLTIKEETFQNTSQCLFTPNQLQQLKEQILFCNQVNDWYQHQPQADTGYYPQPSISPSTPWDDLQSNPGPLNLSSGRTLPTEVPQLEDCVNIVTNVNYYPALR